MCLTDLRQKKEKCSLIVDNILRFAKTVLVMLSSFVILSHLIRVCWAAEVLGFIHPVLVLPDAEPFDQILGALQFGMKTVLLAFEPSHILHRHEYHLLLAVRVFGFDLQLLYILVSDLWSFSGAPALVGFCAQEV